MSASANRPLHPLLENHHLHTLRSNLLSRPKSFNLFSNNPKLSPNKISALHQNPTSKTPPTSDPNQEIRRLCFNDDLDLALHLFGSSKEEHRLEEDTLIALVKLCEWRRAVAEGFKVYSHISSSNTHLTLALGNALLGMLVRLEELLDAWSVFGKMTERDAFSWNVMIGGYGKLGFLHEALDLYQRMLWAGARPDIYTFPSALRTCGGVPDLARGRELHAHAVRFGFATEVDVLNALITMYSKCGDLRSARRVFDGMPRRDCISWNAMISGYFENKECVEGMRLFLTMRDVSFDPDLMTLTSVISASGVLSDVRLGKEIHGYAFKRAFSVDVSVHNSLIQMYASCGCMTEAREVFSRAESRDIVSWTTMISAYEKNGSPDKALEIFEQMRAENVSPDEVTLVSVLSACASSGRIDIGIELHELARKNGLVPHTTVENTLLHMYSKTNSIDKALDLFKRMPERNVISWSSMISGFRINYKSFEALNLFRQMQLDVKPNSVTFIAALSSCAAIGALMCGKEIHAQALRRGLGFEGYLPNAVLDLYVKCGRIEYACKQFSTHKSKDAVSWNIMLRGYASRGHGDLALALFHQMEEAGTSPDEVTFIALLCACSRSGMVRRGWDCFGSMKNYNITPNLKHYACMVDLLARAGFLEEAHQFIKDMSDKPDAAIWGALLNGCRIHRNIGLGQLAANHIFELDQESAGYYVLLCNLYASDGQWDQVSKVRKMMREKGLIVDPGCSWVEVRGAIHAFLTADESHPQIKEIYGVLDGLYGRMKAAGFEVPEYRFKHEIEASKADIFCGHSERLAIAYGLISSTPGTPIWVTKNLYMCGSCHDTAKFISKIVRREITVRDTEQFHHFKDGKCSCGDEGYWGNNGG